MSDITAERYHDISMGHRVYGHENKCAHLHGHNYRIYFTIAATSGELDEVGRVLDFSAIKQLLCQWLEDNWDHKFLIWENDYWCATLLEIDPEGVVMVPFNPTAENMAQYLVDVIGPKQLAFTKSLLVMVRVEETRKCSASAYLDGGDDD